MTPNLETDRKILHVDMDAFYASIEIRDNPALRGKPVIVGGAPERRGVVSAASYAARKFGVHSAMPMARALRLCPQAIRVPHRMGVYAEVSQQIRDIFARYTPQCEPLSLDEAFLDVTACEKLFGGAVAIARSIKQAIREELDLVASVGVAPNKFIAKIASDVNKPDGFVVVAPEQVQAFLDPLPVSRLWGAGKATVAVFERMGIRTIGQLRRQSASWLITHFGRHGEHMWQLAHGVDSREVISDAQAKSISHETTFAEDVADPAVLEAWLLHLTEQVAWRLRRAEMYGRTIQLKLRYPDFKTITRSHTLTEATQSTDPLWQIVRQLFRDNWQGSPAIRLIGMGVSGLQGNDTHMQQADLFAQTAPGKTKVDTLTDQINARFGPSTLQRGRSKTRITE
ncbi:MAG: DNA polymerase IV [Gammaproteobacteria bacterium]|nr:DNA polymerase IV [Gammaproteobacteria bacterium]